MAYASQHALDPTMQTLTMGIRTSARCDVYHSEAFWHARLSERAFVFFPTAESFGSVCSQSDNPTNVGFLTFCRISSDYEPYRCHLSDFNISMWLLPFFATSCTSIEAKNSGCTI